MSYDSHTAALLEALAPGRYRDEAGIELAAEVQSAAHDVLATAEEIAALIDRWQDVDAYLLLSELRAELDRLQAAMDDCGTDIEARRRQEAAP